MRDLSGYPDVADLYLAADVLVSDYSSAMFDFAVTGKPILIVAYDWSTTATGFAASPSISRRRPLGPCWVTRSS